MPLLAANEIDLYEIANEQGLAGVPETFNSAQAGSGFGPFVGSILTAIMAIAALLVLLNLIWGAIEWISSGGDKGKLESARNRITQSIIGIIVLAASLAIFTALQTFLGINVINFGGSSNSPSGMNNGGTFNSGNTRPPLLRGAPGNGTTGKSP
ncbi:MAG: pilin [bacterium]|nr:pilin [bacterium]